MLICFKVFVEWPKIGTSWNPKNCGFSICVGSTTGWDYFVATIVGYGMKTIGSIHRIGSSWMLFITLSRLGSSYSSMLSCVVVASNCSPPLPPISFEQVHSSPSSRSLTSDPKIVLDFCLGGEVIGSGLNMSLDVGGFMHIFSRWDWCVDKGHVVVEHVGLLSFKDCSLVIGSSETYHYYAT
jgi:hypothetical protein